MFERLSPRRSTVPLRSGSLVAAATLSLALAGCGGGDSSVDKAAPGSSPVQEATGGGQSPASSAPVARWPLTGEKLDQSVPAHPVYVVKVDNSANSQPQLGLGAADMVVEELVEGGSTRLAVFYYSDLPDNVGPVRSMRASDVGIVKPADATVVASGAAKKTIRLLASKEVPTLTDGTVGFARSADRAAPYNLFVDLADLGSDAGDSWTGPSRPYLEFSSSDKFSGTIGVSGVTAMFSGAHSTDWRYSHHSWVRTNSYADPDDDFEVDNLLLLRVQVGDAGYKDPAGAPVPETDLSGSGEAVLVHGDRALTCTWEKKSRSSKLVLRDGDTEVRVPDGHTFIELVPSDGGNVTLEK